MPFHDEKLLKILYIFKKLFHTTQKRGKNEFYDTDFFGFNSKNKRDRIIKNTMVFIYSFTYTALLMWSPLQDRTMHNVQSPSLKTSNEEFLTKITYLGDYCIESAS